MTNSISTRITEGCGQDYSHSENMIIKGLPIEVNGIRTCGIPMRNNVIYFCPSCKKVAKASLERCEEALNKWKKSDYRKEFIEFYSSEIKILKDCEGLL